MDINSKGRALGYEWRVGDRLNRVTSYETKRIYYVEITMSNASIDKIRGDIN
jgi:hypothetical protein